MIRRSAVAGLTLALLLTGCGGHHTTAKPSSSAAGGAGMRRLAQCIRAHGQPNLPDPVQQEDGSWAFPATGPDKQKLPEACASLKMLARNDARPSPPTAAQMVKLRQFAACLRRNGFPDWPDPDANGVFPIPARLQAMDKRAMDSRLQVCRQYDPGHLAFRSNGGGH